MGTRPEKILKKGNKEVANELNNLIAVKQRIDGQRATLAAELEKLEAEKADIAAGRIEKPSSFALDDVIGLNKTTPIEELNRQIGNLKAALAQPYYADSEYRTASIAYMEAMTAKLATDLNASDVAIEAARTAVDEAEENLAKAKEHKEDLREAALIEMRTAGITGEISSDYAPDYMLSKYMNICSKYN